MTLQFIYFLLIFQIKGLFWLFLIVNGLTVNTTIYITSFISYFDDESKEEIIFGFKYGLAYIIFSGAFTIVAGQGINLFLYKITKESETTEEENEDNQNIDQNSSSQNTNSQQNTVNLQNNMRNRRRRNGEQDNQEGIDRIEEENDAQSQMGQNNGEQNQKNKGEIKIKRTAITDKIFGFPLFFQKLSNTYFKSFTSAQKSNKKKEKQSVKKKVRQKNKEEIKNDINKNTKSQNLVFQTDNKQHHKQKNQNSNQRKIDFLQKRDDKIDSIQPKKQVKSYKNKQDPILNPQLKQLAIQTEQMYNKFMLSKKGQQIQKKIYQLNLLKDIQESDNKVLNLSIELKPTYDNTDHQYFERSQSFSQSQIENHKIKNKINGNNKNKKEFQNSKEHQVNQYAKRFSNTIIPSMNSNQFVKQITKENITINNNHDNSLNNVCVVCFDKQPDSVYMPCGHGGICYDCALDIFKKTGECYLCRIAISQIFQVDVKVKEGKKFKVLAVTQIDNNNSVNPNIHANIEQDFNLQQQFQQNKSNSSSFQNERSMSLDDSQSINNNQSQQEIPSIQQQTTFKHPNQYLEQQQQQQQLQQSHQENQQLQPQNPEYKDNQQLTDQQSFQQNDQFQQNQISQQQVNLIFQSQTTNSPQSKQNITQPQPQMKDEIKQNIFNKQDEMLKQQNQILKIEQQLQQNQNIELTQKLDQEDLQNKSYPDRIISPNALNIKHNYFQNEDMTLEIDNFNKKSSLQINQQNQISLKNQNLNHNCEVDEEVSNELIIFDPDENECEDIQQKEDNNQNTIRINSLNIIQNSTNKFQNDSLDIKNKQQNTSEKNDQNIMEQNKQNITEPNLNKESREQNQNNDLESQISIEDS